MKFLFWPVKPFVVNQKFGEDNVCISLDGAGKLVWKQNTQTCPVGYKSLYSQTNGHNGLDLNAIRWQPCYASQTGIVWEVQTEVARGLGIGIVTDAKYFCNETGKDEHFTIRYWHFIALNVHKGDKVKVGDLIGWCDSTGYSTGDHLHFELKPVVLKDNVWRNVLQNNTHLGAIDPTPYMEDMFALEFAGLWRQVKEITAKLTELLSTWLHK